MTPISTNARDESSPATRVLNAGLCVALLILGIGSWRTLSGLRTVAAANESRDTRAIGLLQMENERLRTGQSTPSLPPLPTPETPGFALSTEMRRVQALTLLTDLRRRGYFATPPPDRFLRRYAMLSENIKRVPQPAYMIDVNGNFGPGFAEFFGLSESENTSLQSALSTWKQAMEATIHAKTLIHRGDDGSVTLEVSPVEEAAAWSGRFATLLQEGLGRERYLLLDALNSNSAAGGQVGMLSGMSANLNFFGDSHATYTVKRTPTGLDIRYSIKGPNRSGGGGQVLGIPASPGETRDRLIKIYGPVMKLFPPDF